jgi:hypothetical protein
MIRPHDSRSALKTESRFTAAILYNADMVTINLKDNVTLRDILKHVASGEVVRLMRSGRHVGTLMPGRIPQRKRKTQTRKSSAAEIAEEDRKIGQAGLALAVKILDSEAGDTKRRGK